MQKIKLLKYCFYYYSITVLISTIYFTAPKINIYNNIELAKETTPVHKEINKPLVLDK